MDTFLSDPWYWFNAVVKPKLVRITFTCFLLLQLFFLVLELFLHSEFAFDDLLLELFLSFDDQLPKTSFKLLKAFAYFLVESYELSVEFSVAPSLVFESRTNMVEDEALLATYQCPTNNDRNIRNLLSVGKIFNL